MRTTEVFFESYNKRDFEELGINFNSVQDNHSLSIQAGVLRGTPFLARTKSSDEGCTVFKGCYL
ncbi:MAG: dTDP-4-dehydrorhamnose 3,5-epimerase [Hydrogenothermaceae bacterium]|nr:dTDP-4-dehydrorhamnose 3,5-epimerase [Hydrogenothermaceae bacterium]